MAGHGAHITAIVRSHASGDEDAFCSVALQVAAREARQGHYRLASDIKKAVESSRQRARTPLATVSALPRPEGDIAGLAALEAVRGVPGGWDSALDGEDIVVFAELVGRARTAARGSV